MITPRPPVATALACAAVLVASLLSSPADADDHRAPRTSGHDPLPLVSRNVPAYANDTCGGQYPASLANDGSYDTQWRTCNVPTAFTPMTIAYDLSGVPASSRGRLIVAWYNDPATSSYDHTFVGVGRPVGVANDIPATYTIEANAAPGGALPSVGWVTLASVSGNSYHSRQHLVSFSGYTWLRMNITESDGSPANQSIFLNLDVHDATGPIEDDWIFFGDSITEGGMAHSSLGAGTWAQLIAAANPGYFPAYESGGIGGTLAADGANGISRWLSIFPGRYVGLSYGSNDAGSNVPPSTFYSQYAQMVDAVLGAEKIPVVPKIPWSCNPTLQANVPGLNAQIDALYAAYPQIVRGPDLWAYFQSHPGDLSSDCLHPTASGYVAYRQQWTNAMTSRVYRAGTSSTPAPSATRTPAPTMAPTPTPTPTPILPLPTLPPLF